MSKTATLSNEPYKSMWINEKGLLCADFSTPHLHGEQKAGGKWETEVGDTTWGSYVFRGAEFFVITATHYVDYGGEVKFLSWEGKPDPRPQVIVRSQQDGLWRRMPTYNFELDDSAIQPLKDAKKNGYQIAIDFENNGSGRIAAILIDGERFPRE